ncbi:MAG TPA: YezD family protein [Candidatus Baltobacteraceae bacterium]|nr:YezD family protein [Candidatus Baltobacteraceae bacterium]
MNSAQAKTSGDSGGKPDWLEIVRQQVTSLRYGVVEIVVHDSQVTQIEKTERVRLDRPRP